MSYPTPYYSLSWISSLPRSGRYDGSCFPRKAVTRHSIAHRAPVSAMQHGCRRFWNPGDGLQHWHHLRFPRQSGGISCQRGNVCRMQRVGPTTLVRRNTIAAPNQSSLLITPSRPWAPSWPMLRRVPSFPSSAFYVCTYVDMYSVHTQWPHRCDASRHKEPGPRPRPTPPPGMPSNWRPLRCIPCVNITVLRPNSTHRTHQCTITSHRASQEPTGATMLVPAVAGLTGATFPLFQKQFG